MVKKNVFYTMFLLFFLVILLSNTAIAIKAFTTGISIWAVAVLPALLPFSFITKLISNEQLFSESKKKFRLLNTSAVCNQIFFLSLLSGYPVGAKMVSDAFADKRITALEATKLASITSVASPAFIIGTIGITYISNARAGVIILISHLLATLLNGILYRNSYNDPSLSKNEIKKRPISVGQAMSEAINGSLMAGGFIAFFSVFNAILNNYLITYNVFNINSFPLILATINSTIEISGGLKVLSEGLEINSLIVLMSALTTFGGFSIIMQSFVYYNTCKIPLKKLLIFKLTQSAFATIISYLIVQFIKL